jgi:hypothetical protein
MFNSFVGRLRRIKKGRRFLARGDDEANLLP